MFIRARNRRVLKYDYFGQTRAKWRRRIDFLLCCIGLNVGLGNIWRFPLRMSQHGNGAFLIIYIFLMLIIGQPLVFAEMAIGQFAGVSSLRIWKCLPIAKGIGFAYVLLCFVQCMTYVVFIAYSLRYLVESFRNELAWKECHEWWKADENCVSVSSNRSMCEMLQSSKLLNDSSVGSLNHTWLDQGSTNANCTPESAALQFWRHYILNESASIKDVGILKWDLVLALAVAWSCVYFGVMHGIKTTAKVVYVTATFPFIMFGVLAGFGCTLEGASDGLKHHFAIDAYDFLKIQVWMKCAEQLFFSLSIGSGTIITYSSYNKMDNPVHRDSFYLVIFDFLCSILCSIFAFSMMGRLSKALGVHRSTVINKGGTGLVFVLYPEALSLMPSPQFWTFLFFLALFLLVVDSAFCLVETMTAVFFDDFPYYHSKKWLFTLIICFLEFLLGLTCVTQGGIYVVRLVDVFVSGYATVFVATAEIIALMWGYGVDKFASDIEFMLGFYPNVFYRICWKYLSPTLLLILLVATLIDYKEMSRVGTFSSFSRNIGWSLLSCIVLLIPIFAIREIIKHKGNVRHTFMPHKDWGPASFDLKKRYKSLFPPVKNFSQDFDLKISVPLDEINGDDSGFGKTK